MKKIVVLGGGGHAKVLISLLKKLNHHEVLGYVDRVDRGAILGIPYLGTDDTLAVVAAGETSLAAMGLGQLKDPLIRQGLAENALKMGMEFPPPRFHRCRGK